MLFRELSFGDVLGLLLAVLACTGFILVVRARSHGRLESDAGPVGALVAIAVTVYSLILGLTVVATWDRFTQAERTLSQEMNALFTTVRLADAYSVDYQARIDGFTLMYARDVLATELTADSSLQTSSDGARAAIRGLYAVVAELANDPDAPQTSVQLSLGSLVTLDNARGDRLSLTNEILPDILWAVLVAGGIITIASIGLVAPSSKVLHVLVAGSATIIVVLLLNMIADLDQPFTYPIRIDIGLFENGIDILEDETVHPAPRMPATTAPSAPPAP